MALDGAARHVDELGEHAHLDGVLEQRVLDDRAVDELQAQVAHVDGEAHSLGQVKALLATAKLCIVRYVVVDERCGVEMLDGRRGADRPRRVAAHGHARREADEGTMTLAPVAAELEQRRVEIAVHVGMRALGDVRVDDVAHRAGVTVEVFLERFGLVV